MKKGLSFLAYSLFFFIHSANSQDTIVLQPGPEGKDAIISTRYYSQPYPDYPNYFALGWTGSGIPFTTRSLWDFDLSAIPPDAYVISAKLSLFFAINWYNPNLYQTPENQAYLRKIVTPWEETVTWEFMPEFTTEDEVFLPASTSPDQDYTDIDVTELIRDKLLRPEENHGMMLMLENEYPYHAMCFASSDYTDDPSLRPILEIVYLDCSLPEAMFDYSGEELDVFFEDQSTLAESYYWDFGDGYFSDLQNPWHQYEFPGIYEACLTVWNGCGSDDYCQVVDLCSPPEAYFGFYIDGQTAYFEDSSVYATEYYWDFGDGYYSNLPDPYHIYDVPGNYDVCLAAFNECGSDTACSQLNVGTIFIPGNGNASINLHPNPVEDHLFLQSLVTASVEMEILDFNGRPVRRQNLEVAGDSEILLDIADLPGGIYFVRINGDGISVTQKLIKIK